MNNRYFIW